MSFSQIRNSVEKDNSERLKDRAFMANRTAETATGHSRSPFCVVKHAALSQLIKCGWARADSVSLSRTFKRRTRLRSVKGIDIGFEFATDLQFCGNSEEAT